MGEGGWFKRKAVNAWQNRPRSTVEAYEMLRDYIILTPRFQYVWWLSLVIVIYFEVAAPLSMEFFLMTMIYWVVFTCPLLQFCVRWTRMYQDRRHAVVEPEPEGDDEGMHSRRILQPRLVRTHTLLRLCSLRPNPHRSTPPPPRLTPPPQPCRETRSGADEEEEGHDGGGDA